MAKKAPAPQVTAAQIEKAAQTTMVRDLVHLAEAFTRAGVHGPFSVELPVFCAVAVKDKGYRRHNVPTGTRVNADTIRIGKRDGLIFIFKIEGSWVCDKGPVEWIELGWDDVINVFGNLADDIEKRLASAGSNLLLVKDIDTAVKATIAKNPAMHKVLDEGFVLAQKQKKEGALAEVDQSHPLWGAF